MRGYFFGIALVLSASLSACGGAQDPSMAEPVLQSAQALTDVQIPPGCPPAKGNEKGVGAPCTKGGRQCRYPSPICSVDASSSAPVAFCTRPCSTDANCGKGAKCRPSPENPALHGCVPEVCLAGQL